MKLAIFQVAVAVGTDGPDSLRTMFRNENTTPKTSLASSCTLKRPGGGREFVNGSMDVAVEPRFSDIVAGDEMVELAVCGRNDDRSRSSHCLT
jgi:hypothetical protein